MKSQYTILGRIVGVAEGWDELGQWGILLYDLEPSIPAIPSGDVLFDLETGTVTTHDSEGNVTFVADIIHLLKDAPMAKKP